METNSPSATLPLLALVGSANSGKTTLFNALTGSHYSTVNYPGATVEYALGVSRHLPDFPCRVMDTPGLTSLVPSSPDEKVTVDALFKDAHQPDVVLVVADVTQLSRHLYLFRQLQELGFPLVLAVTMEDLLRRKGLRLDEARLSELLDCPVIAMDPRKPDRLPALSLLLKKTRFEARDLALPSHADYASFASELDETHIASLFNALDEVERLALRPASDGSEEALGVPPASVTPFGADHAGADGILLHPFWGLLIFLISMCAIFTAIFWVATPLMDGIDFLFGHLVATAKQLLPRSWLTDLFADGLLGGIGAVSVFLPQIAILFLSMGYLEDSGYLARGAALVDRPLSKIGLNGKSFVPLLSGYACAIPAMMAARTISNRFERRLTVFIIPLMSCSARLPVYALLLAFLIPKNKPWLGGLALTGLYMMGIVLGAIVSTVISRFSRMRSREHSGFMLELPALRKPVPRVVAVSAWHKTAQYIRKAGPAIVVISLGLWVLTHTPTPPKSMQDASEYVTVSHSYAASIGHVIEPLTRPLGLDWRGGVAMICGFAAREVFVSSLALVYRVQETHDDAGLSGKLLSRMHDLRFEETGAKIFTPSTCIGMIVFFMIALQCLSTVAVARKEFGSWRPAVIQLALFTGGAYVLSVIVVQGLRVLGVA